MRADYRLVRGADLSISELVARGRLGAAIDLTGAAIKWRIGTRFATLQTLDTSDGVTVTTAASGIYDLDLDGALSAVWQPGRLRHEVEVTEAGGQIHLVLEGFIDLERDLQ